MAKAAEPIRPVIVKKIYEAPHAGHHGGAWKVAYADFVTAMMAFFLLMWLLGATTEKQRKALADYFSPTLVASKQDSAGSTSFFGGDSITSVDKYPHRAGQTGTRSMTIPRDATGGPKEASGIGKDRAKFQNSCTQRLLQKLQSDKAMKRFTPVTSASLKPAKGLRIDMVDEADFSMFVSGTDILTPDSVQLSKPGRRYNPRIAKWHHHPGATPMRSRYRAGWASTTGSCPQPAPKQPARILSGRHCRNASSYGSKASLSVNLTYRATRTTLKTGECRLLWVGDLSRNKAKMDLSAITWRSFNVRFHRLWSSHRFGPILLGFCLPYSPK